MKDEFEYINQLLDFYDVLLTDKQRTTMDLYYRENYSLSEIGENLSISRSAVQDSIKRVVKSLKTYELKLELVDKFNKRCKIYNVLSDIADVQVQQLVEKLNEIEQ